MKTFIRRSILIAVMLFLIILPNVKADTNYVNNNGIEITSQEYEKLLSIMPKSRIEQLTQDEFAKYINSKIVDQQVFYQRVRSSNKGIISEEYITEAEYNNAPNIEYICKDSKDDIENNRSSDDGYIETTYKRFSATLSDFGNYFDFSSLLVWKKVPACRSYDVFAFRLNHMTYSNVVGVQTYYKGNSSTNIGYNSSSPGYKNATNGAGFSMNLKDDSDITEFNMYMAAELTINDYNSSTAHVYTTYQHAISSLTRTQSMSYTFSTAGLGNVVYYSNTNISHKYDDMAGIHLTTPI